MREHIDIHAGWVTPMEREAVLVTPEELAHFSTQLEHLTPTQRRVLRARAAGQSIPEIAAASLVTASAVRNAGHGALCVLGIDIENTTGRITRAAYLLGRVEGQRTR
jgi:DNA-binding NarL/FixJ family response regulator